MTKVYEDKVILPDNATLSTIRMVLDVLRGHGSAELVTPFDRGVIRFAIEAEDLWDLRETLADIEDTLKSEMIDYSTNKELVKEGALV